MYTTLNEEITKLAMYDTIGMIKESVKNMLRKTSVNIELTCVWVTAIAIAMTMSISIITSMVC